MIKINKEKSKKVIDNAFKNGKIANIEFIKKDGSLRSMTCRKSVKKHLKGGESTIKHKTNLISVYDLKAKGYRCFDINKVVKIKTNGKIYNVEE